MTKQTTQSKPLFSKQQLEILEKTFPAYILQPRHTENEIHHYFGQQSVIAFIRKHTMGSNSEAQTHIEDNASE